MTAIWFGLVVGLLMASVRPGRAAVPSEICATDVRNGQTLMVNLDDYTIRGAECIAGQTEVLPEVE